MENRPGSFSPFHSIRVRVVVLVIVLMAGATLLLSRYTLHQFEAATTFELEQEGILLSDALEAAILPELENNEIATVQDHIDRLIVARDRNDIEINIIVLENVTRSAIVASNIPDNIEETSPEEHASFLASHEQQHPIIFIDRDIDEEPDQSDPVVKENDVSDPLPTDPDYYFSNGQRFLSITTPLISNGQPLGSINLKLSLARIDKELADIRQTLRWASLVELLLVTGGLILLLNGQIFNPLQRMTQKMHSIAQGDLSQRVAYSGSPNEIGWLANTFDHMLAQLQTAFNREKRFTANVAHELRTPLTALKGKIGVTLTHPRTAPEYIDTLQKLELEVDRLSRLSHDLLFLARLEQGQLRPNLEEQDLSDLLEAIAEQMQPLAEAKGICLTLEIAPHLSIRADGDHLIRLFMNLLDNAIKYTPPEGQVVIRARPDDASLQINITDSGPGIAPEHQTLLFGRFYRVNPDRSRDSGGVGLGLTIAKEIVQAHNGQITVYSSPAEGATFTVVLPL